MTEGYLAVLKCKWLAQNVGVIANFLSAEECQHFIDFSESKIYEDAPVTTDHGMVMMKNVRNNHRVMVDDIAEAACLYQRATACLPPRLNETWHLSRLNERLRFYRYDVGQKFDWHHDGSYQNPAGEHSFFTFMIYLNDGFDGGETKFAGLGSIGSSEEDLSIAPKRGMALIFEHAIPHIGTAVTRGRKYVLRSDVMYRRIPSEATDT